MNSFFSWSLPKTKSPSKIVRRVSRLDLFFDLMYVLIFRDLFYVLQGDISIDIFAKILLFFVPIRLIRQGYNFYVQRFEETTIRHRVMTFVLMGLIGVYGFSLHDYGLEVSQVLVISGALGHLLLGYLFISATKFNFKLGPTKIALLVGSSHVFYAAIRLAGYYVGGAGFDIIIALTSLLLILVIFSIPFVFDQVPKIDSSHLGERFGLFIIIVLAELIYGLIAGLSDAIIFDIRVLSVGIGGFLMSIVIWGLYFDIIGHNPIKKKSLKYVTHWSLLHLPLSLSIIYLGGMFLHMIFQVSSDVIQTELMFFTGLMVVSIFGIIGLLSFFHKFEFTKYKKHHSLPKHILGYVMLVESVLMALLLRFLQISTPVVLLLILFVFYGINIVLFHIYIDPLDPKEDFQ